MWPDFLPEIVLWSDHATIAETNNGRQEIVSIGDFGL
jgi:hypothetical protein